MICLICKRVNSVLKEFNVKRLYETNHEFYGKFMDEERTRFHRGLSVCIFPVQPSIKYLLPDLALSQTPDVDKLMTITHLLASKCCVEDIL